jgi:hypothetical protein
MELHHVRGGEEASTKIGFFEPILLIIYFWKLQVFFSFHFHSFLLSISSLQYSLLRNHVSTENDDRSPSQER